MKICSICGLSFDESQFYQVKSGKNKGRFYSYCKSCACKKSSERYMEHKDELNKMTKEWQRKNKSRVAFYNAKHLYGVTEEEYNSLTNRNCQICGSDKNLSIDHSHQTGKVRGTLCKNCNFALGFFNDDPVLLKRAVEYLSGEFEPNYPSLIVYESDIIPGIIYELDRKGEE